MKTFIDKVKGKQKEGQTEKALKIQFPGKDKVALFPSRKGDDLPLEI
jgi:hypothetical protein